MCFEWNAGNILQEALPRASSSLEHVCVVVVVANWAYTNTGANPCIHYYFVCWLMAWLEVARRSRLSTSAITVWCCFLSVVFGLDLPLSLISILCAAQLWLEHLIESISFFVDDDQTAQIPNHATQCGWRTISHNIYIVFGSTILFFFLAHSFKNYTPEIDPHFYPHKAKRTSLDSYSTSRGKTRLLNRSTWRRRHKMG